MMGPPEEHVAPAHAMKYAGVRASKVEAYDAGKKAEEEAPARSRVDGNKELRIRADPTGAKPFVFDAVERPESRPPASLFFLRARRQRAARREGKKFTPALNKDGWTVNKDMVARAPEVRERRQSSIIGYLRMKSKQHENKEKGARRLAKKREAVGLRAKWGDDAGEMGVVNIESHALRLGDEDGSIDTAGTSDGRDFLRWDGPYHFAWQTVAPDVYQSSSMRHLQGALAATHDGTDQVVGYNWREVREILVKADAHAAESPCGSADATHSALHVACWRGDGAAAARALAAAGADGARALVRSPNASGRTPLHLLCEGSRPYHGGAAGRAAVLRVLVEHGADANAPDGRQRTPLHAACAAGDVVLVRALLGAGADERRADDRGRLPVQVAAPPQQAHTCSVPHAFHDAIGPERNARMRIALKASDFVAAFVKEAVAKNRPYRPFSYYLYREGRFPRANSVRTYQGKKHDVYRAGGRKLKGHPGGRQSF